MKKILFIMALCFSPLANAAGLDYAAFERFVFDRSAIEPLSVKLAYAEQYFDVLRRLGTSVASKSECVDSISLRTSGFDPCTPLSLFAQAQNFEPEFEANGKRVKGGGTGGVD